MTRFFAQSLLPLLILFAFYFFIIPESYSQEADNEVLLVDWESMDCDDTYDPFRLKDRISSMEYVNGLLHIQVNFSEHCCPTFDPAISFEDNRLELLSDTVADNEICMCVCCFSIEYQIAGLTGKDFEVYFNGKKIEESDDYYETQEVTYEYYQGEKINLTNKYGFKEGIWMSFHDNGAISHFVEFPEEVLYHETNPLWHKNFSEKGQLIYYDRKDSSQSWFDDGEVRNEDFKYIRGDTSFRYLYLKYSDRSLREKSLEISYPVDVDPCIAESATTIQYLYKESYYKDGKRKYLLSNDTTYEWYENGQLDEVNFPGGSKRYKKDGSLGSQVFRWSIPGPECRDDLQYRLYVYYDAQASIKKIDLTRDEAVGKKVYAGRDYIWTWDENKRLTSKPEDWDEAFPWVKFELILEQLKAHEMP